MKMKPFDLKLALNGHSVVTSKGHKVKIAGYNEYAKPKAKVVGWIWPDEKNAEARSWSEEGEAAGDDDFNLFMAPVKNKGWVTIIPSLKNLRHMTVFGNEECARSHEQLGDITVPIEWEE